VKREVWKRDGGRCQWPVESGGICGSTFQVEFDHVRPLAMGGESTVENTRLACRPHNLHAARLLLGDELMDRYARGAAAPRADAAAPGP
jgi:5-methylcytosine-specific restriction endonuclease McrA